MIKMQCMRKYQQRHYVKGCTTIGVTLSIQLGTRRIFSKKVSYRGNWIVRNEQSEPKSNRDSLE